MHGSPRAALWWHWVAATFFAAAASGVCKNAQFAAQLFCQSKGFSSHDWLAVAAGLLGSVSVLEPMPRWPING